MRSRTVCPLLCRLSTFYRQALVFPVLAAVCVGLLSLMGLLCHEKWTSNVKVTHNNGAHLFRNSTSTLTEKYELFPDLLIISKRHVR